MHKGLHLRACDVETTGLPGEEDTVPTSGVMQIGWCDYVVGDPIGQPVGFYVDCGIPVSIGARAVHHISNEMVAGEMPPDEACRRLGNAPFTALVAHNIDHEKRYLGAGFKPGTEELREWLCTYKIAFRLWPDAPGHKLQELRYYLELDNVDDFNPKFAEPPHRAPADAYICAHLLRRVLHEAAEQKIAFERLVKWSSGPALLTMCWMKKHKGETWASIARTDRPYLQWIYDSFDSKDRDLIATVKYWLKQTAPMI